MGWGGGTEVFDLVADELIENNNVYSDGNYYGGMVVDPLVKLYRLLGYSMDWDNEQDSKYWDDPVIGRILGNTFEEDEE